MTSVLDVCRRFVIAHPAEAARALERLPPHDVASLLEADARLATTIVRALVPTQAADSLAAMAPGDMATILLTLPPDVAADLLRRMHADARAAALDALPQDQAGPLRTLLSHGAGTAGALLDPRALSLPDSLTAAEGARRLRRSAGDLLYYIYLVDERHRLTGVLDVRELLTARPDAILSSIMGATVARLHAAADPDAILSHPGWRIFHALPVVGDDGVLLGAIRYETLRRLEAERAAQQPPHDTRATARALGELYWIGVSGIVEGLVSTSTRGRPAASDEPPREREA